MLDKREVEYRKTMQEIVKGYPTVIEQTCTAKMQRMNARRRKSGDKTLLPFEEHEGTIDQLLDS